MRNPSNFRLVLARRPGAVPSGDDFRIEHDELPPVRDRQLLLRTLAISIDRCANERARGTSLCEPGMDLGEVMRGCTVSEVVESRHPAFKPGDAVLAWSGWQEREVVDGSSIRRKLHRNAAPPMSALGAYGIYGYVAYKAMQEVARPVAGETVLIGSAASPTGEIAGQIARQRGARVVGVTSSAEKCAWLTDELEFDAALDRQVERVAEEKLLAMLPDELRPTYSAALSPAAPEIQQLVKAADKLSAYIKCLEELKAGNQEFGSAAEQTRQALEDYRMPELDYFLTHFLPAFSCTLDQLQAFEAGQG